MSRDKIEAALDQANKVESMLRVMSMAIEGEQICPTSFADNGGGVLIDIAIEAMRHLGTSIDQIDALERAANSKVSATV
tara:strand:- start:131 stop:367 length:237 start_codon:yes stop_codon:yes gene_type:complete